MYASTAAVSQRAEFSAADSSLLSNSSKHTSPAVLWVTQTSIRQHDLS
jgi:hypothetical protein